MDEVTKILSNIGLNQSFFYQISILIISFFILKYTFFKKIFSITSRREAATTLRKKSVESLTKAADGLEMEYKKSIKDLQSDASERLEKRNFEYLMSETKKLRKREADLSKIADKYKQDTMASVLSLNKEFVEEMDHIADQFINKYTK